MKSLPKLAEVGGDDSHGFVIGAGAANWTYLGGNSIMGHLPPPDDFTIEWHQEGNGPIDQRTTMKQ